MSIYENEFMIIDLIHDGNTLDLQWKIATEEMKTADFKAALYTYAGFAIEYRTPGLLVRIHDFRFNEAMSEEMTRWRDQQIFPKYNGAGVVKFAFLGSKEQLPPQDPPQSALANFQTRFFADLNTAATWLNG